MKKHTVLYVISLILIVLGPFFFFNCGETTEDQKQAIEKALSQADSLLAGIEKGEQLLVCEHCLGLFTERLNVFDYEQVYHTQGRTSKICSNCSKWQDVYGFIKGHCMNTDCTTKYKFDKNDNYIYGLPFVIRSPQVMQDRQGYAQFCVECGKTPAAVTLPPEDEEYYIEFQFYGKKDLLKDIYLKFLNIRDSNPYIVY
jgi:hypothetical protein